MSWGQLGAHLGPVGPSWAPSWPHESCYQGYLTRTAPHMMISWHGNFLTRKFFIRKLFSVLLNLLWGEPHLSPVDTPHKVSVTRSFNVSFGVCLNKQLNKQWSCRWFETPWHLCHVKIISKMLYNQGWRHRGGKLTIPITYEIYVYGFLRLFR